MRLYLVRHSDAAERGSEEVRDEDRPLTARGRQKMGEVARAFRKSGLPLVRIVSSPLVRAIQTAELLASGCDYPEQIDVTRILACGVDARELTRYLETSGPSEGLAAVGHEPDMGHLAARFLGRASFPSFKKGAICVLDFDGRSWKATARFGGLLHPKTLEWVREIDALE